MKLFSTKATYFMPIILEKNSIAYGVIRENYHFKSELIFYKNFLLEANQFINGKIMNHYFFINTAQQIAKNTQLGSYFTQFASTKTQTTELAYAFSSVLFLINIGMPCSLITTTETIYEYINSEQSSHENFIKKALFQLYMLSRRDL